MESIIIPEERIAVLLGEKGSVKKEIEKRAQIKLTITNENEVNLEGSEENVYFALDLIKAIGRGFSPNKALSLLKENKALIIINLKDYLNSENSIKRIKARIIGEHGKVKKEIERTTECDLSIYGKTVSIIGEYDCIEYAQEAVMKLINGSQHSTLFNYLANVSRKIMQQRLK